MKITGLGKDANAGADYTSIEFDLGDLTTYSIGVEFSDNSLEGELSLEISVDNQNWKTVTNSVQEVQAGTGHVWNVSNAGYRFVRVFWDHDSGSGTLTIKLIAKELVVKEA